MRSLSPRKKVFLLSQALKKKSASLRRVRLPHSVWTSQKEGLFTKFSGNGSVYLMSCCHQWQIFTIAIYVSSLKETSKPSYGVLVTQGSHLSPRAIGHHRRGIRPLADVLRLRFFLSASDSLVQLAQADQLDAYFAIAALQLVPRGSQPLLQSSRPRLV